MILVGYSYNQPFIKLELKLHFWNESADAIVTKSYSKNVVTSWTIGADYSVGNNGISKLSGRDDNKVEMFKDSGSYESYKASEYIKIIMSEVGESL